jgi:hypothetical protein
MADMDIIISDCLLMFADVSTKQCKLQNPSEISLIFCIHIAFNNLFHLDLLLLFCKFQKAFRRIRQIAKSDY